MSFYHFLRTDTLVTWQETQGELEWRQAYHTRPVREGVANWVREVREKEVEEGVRDIALARSVEEEGENTEKKVEKQTSEGPEVPSEGNVNICQDAQEKAAVGEEVKEKDEVKEERVREKAKALDRPDEESILLGVVVPQVNFGGDPNPVVNLGI